MSVVCGGMSQSSTGSGYILDSSELPDIALLENRDGTEIPGSGLAGDRGM
jgi:hypothetical protein